MTAFHSTVVFVRRICVRLMLNRCRGGDNVSRSRRTWHLFVGDGDRTVVGKNVVSFLGQT